MKSTLLRYNLHSVKCLHWKSNVLVLTTIHSCVTAATVHIDDVSVTHKTSLVFLSMQLLTPQPQGTGGVPFVPLDYRCLFWVS